ncbi:MAG: distal tail protein Dit [Lachnotalea sp.]
MRSNFHIWFNGQSCKDVGLSLVSRPTIPTPEREYEVIKVEGRDGELHKDKKTYKDIEINIKFNFVSKNPNTWAEELRKVKKWLYCKEDSRLILSDDPEYYYTVKKVIMSDTERSARRKGEFTIAFTCEAYMFRIDGQEEKKLNERLYNPYAETQPIYVIEGSGIVTLEVNGNTVKASVKDTLFIDTKLSICYTTEGTLNNAALNGEYESLYLLEGDNSFIFTEGFTVTLIPNWREL